MYIYFCTVALACHHTTWFYCAQCFFIASRNAASSCVFLSTPYINTSSHQLKPKATRIIKTLLRWGVKEFHMGITGVKLARRVRNGSDAAWCRKATGVAGGCNGNRVPMDMTPRQEEGSWNIKQQLISGTINSIHEDVEFVLCVVGRNLDRQLTNCA